MNKIPIVALFGYIGVWAGIAIASVGEVAECSVEPYTASLPFTIFTVLIIPAILGAAASEAAHSNDRRE